MTNAAMMDEFYAAREAYVLDMESSAVGYATEEAEYREANRAPRLGDFMRLRAVPDLLPDPRNYPGCELTDVGYVGVVQDWHEWHGELYVPRRRARYRVIVKCYSDDTWSRQVVHVLKRATPPVTGRAWDDDLHRWADDCLLAAKRL